MSTWRTRVEDRLAPNSITLESHILGNRTSVDDSLGQQRCPLDEASEDGSLLQFGYQSVPCSAARAAAYTGSARCVGPVEREQSGAMVVAQANDLETLQRQVAELACQADRAARAYDRHDRFTWAGYAVIFLATPFAVLLFRLHMEAWH